MSYCLLLTRSQNRGGGREDPERVGEGGGEETPVILEASTRSCRINRRVYCVVSVPSPVKTMRLCNMT